MHADKTGYASNCQQRPIDLRSSAVPRVVSNAECLIGHPENDFGANHETWQANGVDLCPCQCRAARRRIACGLIDWDCLYRRADPRQPRREFSCRPTGCVDLVVVRVVDDLPLWNEFGRHFGKLLHQHHGQSEVTDRQDTARVLARSGIYLGISAPMFRPPRARRVQPPPVCSPLRRRASCIPRTHRTRSTVLLQWMRRSGM